MTHVLDLLLRKAAFLTVSEPLAYFTDVYMILNQPVAAAGLNSFRGIMKIYK